MIQFHISTDILLTLGTQAKVQIKKNYESDARAHKLLRSDTCCSGLLVREKASQQDHLTDADH